MSASFLNGCGLYVPDKNPFASDQPTSQHQSVQGSYENGIVIHVECELAGALALANDDFTLPWLSKWGTAVTLTITSEDQSGLNPGVSILSPLPNATATFAHSNPVVLPQSFSAGFGGSASANATRTETMQFTYRNVDLLRFAKDHQLTEPGACSRYQKAAMIDGDLKIRE